MREVVLYMCGGEKAITEVPLGIGYLMTNVKRAKIRFTTDWGSLQGVDIAGFSTNAWGLREAFDIARRLKVTSPKTTMVIGGQGALWKYLDSTNSHPFHHVVRGDGELAMQAIVDGKTTKCLVTERVENINHLAWPERGQCGSSVPIITSRGCPFKCAFCTSRAQWGKPRLRSVANLADEIEYLRRKYPHMKELYILDDLWAYPEKRFNEFFEWWMGQELNKVMKLRGFIRSNMATKKLFVRMKKMGFSSVRFGAETASPRLLKAINKGATVEDHQRAIDLAAEVGLPITASFMHGLPGETAKDRALTSAFMKKNKGKLKREGYYKFVAFPGCALWNGQDPLKLDMRVR